MSSHREAPEISKDPVADNTDVYAFVSPDSPGTVTLIANYIPLEGPDGGPNFYEFGNDVLYEIHVDNDGDGHSDITYRFRFNVELRNPDTFLYNTGPITSLDSHNFNRRQFYSVSKVDEHGHETLLASHLACPPCNVGPRSMPNYTALAGQAVHHLHGGERVFAGQRLEGFYVDLGAVFDLADLRPFQQLHLFPSADAPGVDATKMVNVHSIAIQVPTDHLTNRHSYHGKAKDPHAVIGVYASASRRKARITLGKGEVHESGPWEQVSRLGNPLVNEVLIPMGKTWGIIPNFQNYTGKTQADMLRLNVEIPPAQNPNLLGILGGDLAGFPNGRRVFDDVFTIELRAIAGATIPLVDSHYEPDAAASLVTDGLTPDLNTRYLPHFPYLGVPLSGFDVPSA